VFIVALALIGAGCVAKPAESWRCRENRCDLSVSGSSTLEVLDARLKATVSKGRIRLSGGGVDVTLNPGEAAIVDGVRVELRSVDNNGVASIIVSE
jgi:hypothetical protein